MTKNKFYGVAGVNGYGVYNDYSKALESKPFIAEFKIKGFHDFNEAKVYAVNTYEVLQNGTLGKYEIEELNDKNWFYRRKLINEVSETTEDALNCETDLNFFSDKRTNRECDAGYIKERISPFNIGI